MRAAVFRAPRSLHRDANDNRVVKDGLIQTGTGGSQFNTNGHGRGGNAPDGAINSTNYAVGNMIDLGIVGSWNTVSSGFRAEQLWRCDRRDVHQWQVQTGRRGS